MWRLCVDYLELEDEQESLQAPSTSAGKIPRAGCNPWALPISTKALIAREKARQREADADLIYQRMREAAPLPVPAVADPAFVRTGLVTRVFGTNYADPDVRFFSADMGGPTGLARKWAELIERRDREAAKDWILSDPLVGSSTFVDLRFAAIHPKPATRVEL